VFRKVVVVRRVAITRLRQVYLFIFEIKLINGILFLIPLILLKSLLLKDRILDRYKSHVRAI